MIRSLLAFAQLGSSDGEMFQVRTRQPDWRQIL
jgi:hypothetical protein